MICLQKQNLIQSMIAFQLFIDTREFINIACNDLNLFLKLTLILTK